MAYLKEIQTQILQRNLSKFFELWEEYRSSDEVDVHEFSEILKTIKNSEFSKPFGKVIESALPLWNTIQDPENRYFILKLLIDLENTNSPALADIAFQALQQKYGQDPRFNDRIRLVGLRTRDQFQGALSNYDLLAHMEKGKFVLHAAGWGAGEIMDVSLVRQQLGVEFENVSGIKQITFDNAFKTLIPIPETHFLSRRFADPDAFEKEAKEDPVGVIKLLLKDLGPKTAAEIKDELAELVIPEAEWVRWWQNTRSKLKKDPLIDSPESLKETFKLRQKEISQEELMDKAIQDKTGTEEFIQAAYTFLRDAPNVKKNADVRLSMKEKLLAQLSIPQLSPEHALQIKLCLESYFPETIPAKEIQDIIQNHPKIEALVNAIDIIALKKKALSLIKEYRKDWEEIFLNLVVSLRHSSLRDYLFKELSQSDSQKKLGALMNTMHVHPEKYPEFFLWLFQKALAGEEASLSTKSEQCKLFEAFLLLLHRLEFKPEYKELVKKMYLMLVNKRYALVRDVMEGASLHDVKEFLLLASKCQTLTDHDKKILHSLAAVVHSDLAKKGDQQRDEEKMSVIWTTEEGYLKVQEKVKHIGTVEIVENAREIEAARALGDLRENSEFKFALERRSRLQNELKSLSEQLNKARILTRDDIIPDEVHVGSVVEVKDEKGKKAIYTILGPWDADPEKQILSFQSKLAQAMVGCKKGDTFVFRDEKMSVSSIRSFFDK